MSEPTIPKFGSFRPKAQAAEEPPKDSERESKHHSKTGDRKGRRDQEDDRRHHRPRRRHRSRSKSRERPSKPPDFKATPIPLPNDNSPEIFVIDRKGDEKNLIYNSIHRYSVPPFHRLGAGNVLGAPPNIKIDRDAGDDKGIVLRDWRDSNTRWRERDAFSKIEREKPRLLRIRPAATSKDQDDLNANYVPLDTSGSRKRRKIGVEGHDVSASDEDDDETHYRSIHGKKKATADPEDGALQYATESDSGYEDGIPVSNLAIRQRNIELSRRVEEFPHEIDSWLALIELQDTLLRDEEDRHRATNAEIRSTAEIKIHMYEKALERATSLQDRERLLLGLMAEGANIWDSNLQTARWEKISKDNIDSLMLWKSYLNFKQTTFTTFRYEEIRDIFLTRIELLSKEASKAWSNDADSVYQQLIYVLLRATLFIRESGYLELGVAIWQGVLEINFQGPEQSLSTPMDFNHMSDFWESEVARIGEDGALGWRFYLENQGNAEAPPGITDEPEISLTNARLFKSWAAAERSRSVSFPARTMDDVIENDPYRVILFSDIERFLISLPPQSEDLHKALLDAFLVFCRLSPMSALDREFTYGWSNDTFVGDGNLECSPDYMKKDFPPSTQTNEDVSIDNYSVLRTPSPNFQVSSETMFSSKFWFEGVRPWSERYNEHHNPLSYSWVRNVLKQLTQTYFREYLAEYHLAFEWRNEPATIKKIAKGLLKKHTASLRLYNSYAMVEHARGNDEISDAVFSSALNMSISSSNDSTSTKESILLWRNYIWSKLEASDKSSALQLLFSIPNGVISNDIATSPAALLKTKQHLLSNRDHLLSSGETSVAVIYAELLALLEYVTCNSGFQTQSNAQGDISSALKAFTSFSIMLSDRMNSQTISHELLLQSASRLLYHHARIGPFRPALLRKYFTNFLELFPRNIIFLALYTWNESRLRIDNRVRKILQSTVLTPVHDTVTSRLFAIHYEVSHGTIHSARSAFEHALSSTTCSSSAGLWRFYILYCLETPTFRSKAKDIWYRALRACPWAKELYIVGFEEMDDLLEFGELKRTWRVMGEKELRVHVDLMDHFEGLEDIALAEREKKSLAFR